LFFLQLSFLVCGLNQVVRSWFPFFDFFDNFYRQAFPMLFAGVFAA
jgi:hypothetical protein